MHPLAAIVVPMDLRHERLGQRHQDARAGHRHEVEGDLRQARHALCQGNSEQAPEGAHDLSHVLARRPRGRGCG